MNLATEFETIENLTTNLRHIMKLKGITEAELARKTHIPQPTLHKILSGKTNDPRASTVKSLADFFDISIDELLTGAPSTKSQNTASKTQSIPIISWGQCIDATNYIKNLTPTNWSCWIVSEFLSEHAYALTSKPCSDLRFPKGTVLIIDPKITAEDGDMVIVHYPNTQEATLREISI